MEIKLYIMSQSHKARDMLDRMGVENAQSFSAGDLGELANLINDSYKLKADARRYTYLKIMNTSIEAFAAFEATDHADSIDVVIDERIDSGKYQD